MWCMNRRNSLTLTLAHIHTAFALTAMHAYSMSNHNISNHTRNSLIEFSPSHRRSQTRTRRTALSIYQSQSTERVSIFEPADAGNRPNSDRRKSCEIMENAERSSSHLSCVQVRILATAVCVCVRRRRQCRWGMANCHGNRLHLHSCVAYFPLFVCSTEHPSTVSV